MIPLATAVILDGGGTVTLDIATTIGHLELGGAGSGTLQVASTGILNIASDYTQAIGGTLQIELADSATGKISVSGSAELGGNLKVILSPGFDPTAGDAFNLLSASTILGAFDSVQLPVLVNGLSWHLQYEPTGVVLTVLYSADFDR